MGRDADAGSGSVLSGYHRPEPYDVGGDCAPCVHVGGGRHTYLSAQGRSYDPVPPSLGAEMGRGREEAGGEKVVRSSPGFSLPGHPGPVERVSTSFSAGRWRSRALAGASSLVEFIRCTLGSSLGHRTNPDASSPVHLSQAKRLAMPIQIRTRLSYTSGPGT